MKNRETNFLFLLFCSLSHTPPKTFTSFERVTPHTTETVRKAEKLKRSKKGVKTDSTMDIQDQAYKFLANIREGGFSKLSPLVAQFQREGLWSPFKDSIVPGITVVRRSLSFFYFVLTFSLSLWNS